MGLRGNCGFNPKPLSLSARPGLVNSLVSFVVMPDSVRCLSISQTVIEFMAVVREDSESKAEVGEVGKVKAVSNTSIASESWARASFRF